MTIASRTAVVNTPLRSHNSPPRAISGAPLAKTQRARDLLPPAVRPRSALLHLGVPLRVVRAGQKRSVEPGAIPLVARGRAMVHALVTDNDKHALSVLLDALDRLYESRLSSTQLRTILLETRLDSAELAAEVHEAAHALRGVLRLDTRIEPPYSPLYKDALEATAKLRALLADVYDEFWASVQR